MPDLLLPAALLEQHQSLRDAGEDTEEDGGDEEMTSVCDRLACGGDTDVCGSP